MAIDGTGSEEFATDPQFLIRFRDGSGTIRTQSHIKNFFDDYYGTDGIQKRFWHGPADDFFGVSGQMQTIHNEVMAFLSSQLGANPNRRVDIVGHSRGGYAAMEIARDLQTEGINGQVFKVRFLGLYDPVDMAVFYGDAETVSRNVETAAVVFASGTSAEVGVDPLTVTLPSPAPPILVEQRSRGIFNRADHGPESPYTDYDMIWIFGTHGAIGGAPWEGDHPAGHTEENDRIKAVQSDQFVRNKARSKQVPINLVDDYGYNWLDEE